MKGSSSGAGDADLQSICSPDGWEINSQGLITPEMGREKKKKKSLTLFSQHISKHCEESRDFSAHPRMPEPPFRAVRAAVDHQEVARLMVRMMKYRCHLPRKHLSV